MITRTEFVRALAHHLDALGLARYNPTAPYSPGGPGIPPAIFTGQRPDTPGDAITLRVYDENLDRDDANPDMYVQIRVRRDGTDERPVDDTADAIRAALHDRSHFVMPGGISVKLCRRKIAGMSEPDSAGRWSRPDSYIFTLDPKGTS